MNPLYYPHKRQDLAALRDYVGKLLQERKTVELEEVVADMENAAICRSLRDRFGSLEAPLWQEEAKLDWSLMQNTPAANYARTNLGIEKNGLYYLYHLVSALYEEEMGHEDDAKKR